jgi:hypothetical protein
VGSYAFAPILFAQSAVLAGLIVNRIFCQGHNLSSNLNIGTLAASYVSEFEEKWLPAGNQKSNAHGDELLGSGDIQSLADLGNSFGFIREMRFVPSSLDDVFRLAATTTAPLLPLLLTIMPLEELLSRVIKIVF